MLSKSIEQWRNEAEASQRRSLLRRYPPPKPVYKIRWRVLLWMLVAWLATFIVAVMVLIWT